MVIINNFNTFWVLFITFIFAPPATIETRQARRGARRQYDSDFKTFMQGMYRDLPQHWSQGKGVDEHKRGPNPAYRPYWYGYNFVNHYRVRQTIGQDSDHEIWDYGLGDKGMGLWGKGQLTLMAGADDFVGSGRLVDQDTASQEEEKRDCYVNMGPTCVLGRAPDSYSRDEITMLFTKTKKCDVCRPEHYKIGLVCTVDVTGQVFQEMDYCVMEKMNCLGGTAAVAQTGVMQWQIWPFAFKPYWGRFAVWGENYAHIRLQSEVEYHQGRANWILLNYSWYFSRVSGVWEDDWWFPSWWRWWRGPLTNAGWTEYTITWNARTGWLLVSQARVGDWQSVFYIELIPSRGPWDLKYFDISSEYGWPLWWMFFDLPYDLTMVNVGRCQTDRERDDFPTDSEEVKARVKKTEVEYKRRIKKFWLYPERWSGEDPAYLDDPAAA